MIDYGAVKQRLAEFDARHGASVAEDGWILFEDGAVRESDPMGVLMAPPSKPWDLTRRVLHYQQVILNRAVAAFEERRSYYVRAATANLNQQFCAPAPTDPELAAAELKQLQRAVRAAKRKYDAALAAVEAAKPPRLRELEATNAANRKANEALLTSLNGIEV